MPPFMRCLIVLVVALSLAGQQPNPGPPPWQQHLTARISEFGHRNWIVIADSAYPAQARPAIETVLTGANHVEVVNTVLEELAKTKHLRPVVYLDAELRHVTERDAPGIDAYREQLRKLLASKKPATLPHDQIIEKLDHAGEKFRVLILKTPLTLPYTSVFLELDCGYWSPEAEARLRRALESDGEK